MSEIEIGRAVVQHLTDQGWDVYQEVQFNSYSAIADVVGVRGGQVLVCECKTSLGLRVLNQAFGWTMDAHLVYVGVPASSRYRGRADDDFAFACRVARQFGIGVFAVGSGGVHEQETAKELHGRSLDDWLKKLTPHHKTYAEAGNANGQRWSPFKQTMFNVKEFVTASPGCSMKELIAGIQHHYGSAASARNVISKWIADGQLPGVKVEREGRGYRVWPS